MPYLNCPNCRLTVYAPADSLREECPRCAARLGKASRLFRSQLPHRLMQQLETSVQGKGRTDSPGG